MRLALKVVMQNYWNFMVVILLYRTLEVKLRKVLLVIYDEVSICKIVSLFTHEQLTGNCFYHQLLY